MAGAMTERSKDWNEGYEVGHREGENSANADWIIALEGRFDLKDIEGPQDFIEKIKWRVLH